MSHTRPVVLVLLTVVVGALSATLLNFLYNQGASLPRDGVEFGLVVLIISLLSAWLAAQVQRLKKRQSTWMSAVGAARVAALSLALSHTGAIFLGYFGAQTLFILVNLGNDALADMLWKKIVAVIGAVLMTITGLVVEKICTIDPKDPKSQSSPGATPEAA
ncbi:MULTISPECIES: DUF3180 domain-containing protein [Mobiluncus]|uniref:DUF3180 domain-containing protein n=3 Tax=Mobiluncus TaxID=2050 RepID=D6ZIY4_MOBCV|nr:MULTISPECIES: DUF3180 domain-containing protein [Mobiluncus]ADI66683.1 hypothetical protein HMPREF0573_10364 [Mobiluncus curtisii ATCC 43063]EFL93175.1 hypothetical protein HMPREF0574_1776 [Mobiluncus curtisii subsp. curtisii ATCC 35241]EFU82780.1 hypothetical protein HMPREF0576_0110 [Mobiluncus holmesii ATCC 35242]MCU9986823.1 DUF3180 domain-containing protein [Mobiluncus curtisii]MCU9999724.1 DUF3180 domain-containing protein [Mobiluncus curtisii]